MKIVKNFCGSNAEILFVTDNTVTFSPELRDTTTDWFYWAFAVEDGEGTVTFNIQPKNYIGYWGAAYSHDLIHWEWTHTALPDRSGFTYTFKPGEKRVYFAHDMLYHPSQFLLFCEQHGLTVDTLGRDNRGTPLLCTRIGSGSRHIILTTRHHACESTGNYVMEGVIDELLKNPIDNCRVTVIPFMDADGVTGGDQGKNRAPHDHNRDYIDAPLYNAVKAVKELGSDGQLWCLLDFHSPWHIGGRNDVPFIVRCMPDKLDDYRRLGAYIEEEITPDSLFYHTADDLDPNVEWNNIESPTSAHWAASLPGVELAHTLETTYFGREGNIVSQAGMVEFGRCYWRGVRKYLSEK